MKTLKKSMALRHRTEALLMRGLLGLLRFLPVDLASDLGGRMIRAIGPHLGVSRRARRNLTLCGIGDTQTEREAIIRGMWDNLGRTACEYAHLPAFRFYEANSRTEVRGMEHVDHAIAQGKGAIFISGHFANWELLPMALVQRGLAVMAVYRPANNPFADEIINRLRHEAGVTHLAPKGGAGARMLLSWMAGRNYAAMLSDQKMNDGIEAPFFGRPAMSSSAAAVLARRFSCPLIFASIRRTEGAHFIIEAEAPIYVAQTEDRNGDILAAVMEINRRLENFIRAWPEQWLWLHRRWPE